MRRAEIIEREQRWARPAAIATMAGAALVVGGGVLLGLAVGGDTDAERLRAVDDDPAGFLAATIVRALGLALLAVPLAYLFNAAAARSVGMRRQLIGLTVAGPLFIAISTALSGFALAESASEFVSRGSRGGRPRSSRRTSLAKARSCATWRSALASAERSASPWRWSTPACTPCGPVF